MKNIIQILSDFKKRGGFWFFIGSFGNKIISFLISLLIIRAMSLSEYGNWAYALTIVSVVFPFKSFGLENSLMRFGSLMDDAKSKYLLYRYSKKQGLIISSLLAISIILIAPLITKKMPDAYALLVILACWLPSSFLMESKQSYFRLLKTHKVYSISQITQGLTVLCLGLLFYKLWGSLAFAVVFTLVPAIIQLLFKTEISVDNSPIEWKTVEKKKFFSYGLLTALTMVVSQLVFYLDVFLIENLVPNPDEQLAIYRTATLIPMNLAFLAIAFVNNDFVHISEHSDDKNFLLRYLKNYYKLFSIYALAAVLIFMLPAQYWVKIFGEGYTETGPIFAVLVFAILGSILFRIPAGNMLAAIGMVRINTWVSYSAILFNGILSYFLILQYGIIGAAYGTAIILWSTGIFSLVYLLRHIKTKI